jgi:hypothetical protein
MTFSPAVVPRRGQAAAGLDDEPGWMSGAGRQPRIHPSQGTLAQGAASESIGFVGVSARIR